MKLVLGAVAVLVLVVLIEAKTFHGKSVWKRQTTTGNSTGNETNSGNSTVGGSNSTGGSNLTECQLHCTYGNCSDNICHCFPGWSGNYCDISDLANNSTGNNTVLNNNSTVGGNGSTGGNGTVGGNSTNNSTGSSNSTNNSTGTSDVGEFFSPNYPNSYSDRMDVSYDINVGSTPVDVSIEFSSFDIEADGNCGWDYLMIDGIKYCSGSRSPGDELIVKHVSGVLAISFHSDSSVVGSGFSATYTIIRDPWGGTKADLAETRSELLKALDDVQRAIAAVDRAVKTIP